MGKNYAPGQINSFTHSINTLADSELIAFPYPFNRITRASVVLSALIGAP